MSATFIVIMMLLGSAVVTAFVLQPLKKEPAASANSAVSHHRCHGESLQSIKKTLLSSLNLQAEPQLPAGGLDAVREQWRRTFGNVAHRARDSAVPAVSVSPDGGDGSGPKCCSIASEIFMTDLGWDNWVIHPASITIVQCALCNPEGNTEQCPSSHNNVHNSQVQVPCCQPTSHKMVPVVYVDESGSVVISSVQLTSSCACGHANVDG